MINCQLVLSRENTNLESLKNNRIQRAAYLEQNPFDWEQNPFDRDCRKAQKSDYLDDKQNEYRNILINVIEKELTSGKWHLQNSHHIQPKSVIVFSVRNQSILSEDTCNDDHSHYNRSFFLNNYQYILNSNKNRIFFLHVVTINKMQVSSFTLFSYGKGIIKNHLQGFMTYHIEDQADLNDDIIIFINRCAD